MPLGLYFHALVEAQKSERGGLYYTLLISSYSIIIMLLNSSIEIIVCNTSTGYLRNIYPEISDFKCLT